MSKPDGATAVADPLDALRAATSSSPDDPLALIHLRTADGAPADGLASAAQIVVAHVDPATLQRHDDAPELVFKKDVVTRLARSREVLAQGATPSSAPQSFFPLDALVFAVQQRDERAGGYLRNAAVAQIASISALERPALLEYLLGKQPHWDGVLPLGAEAAAPTPTADQAAGKPAEAAPAAAAAPAELAKRAYVPDKEDAEFVKRLRSRYEVVELDRNDALRGSLALMNSTSDLSPTDVALRGPAAGVSGADLRGIRSVIAPYLDAAKRRHGGSRSASTPTAAPTASSGSARRPRAQDPIILLSNSPTSLVNMFNVKALLQDGVFIPPEEARQQAGGIPELVVTIQSRSDEGGAQPGGPTGSQTPAPGRSSHGRRILVVDNAEAVNRLGTGAPGSDQDPWNRVIAVFTKGQLWQFKDYKWSEPRELFRHGASG